IPISEYIGAVPRSSTTSDVFNAVAEGRRREILDALIAGEKAVGTIVDDLSMSQPKYRSTSGYSVRSGSSGAGRRVVVGCTAWSPLAFGRFMTGWRNTSRRGMTDWIGWTTTSKSYNKKEIRSDESAWNGSHRISERSRDCHHSRVRRSARARLRRTHEAGTCAQLVRSIHGCRDGVLDRPPRRRGLPHRLRDRRRNRELVSGNLPGGRAADPPRRDVAVRKVAGYGRRRDCGAARNRRSDDADDEAGVPRPGRPR